MLNAGLLKELVEAKLLQEDAAQQVIEEGLRTGRPVIDLVLEKKLLDEVSLMKFLAQKVGLQFISKIAEQMIDTNLLAKIPFRFLKRYVVVPVVLEGKVHLLAADSRGLQVVDDIGLLLHGELRYAFAPREAITNAINRYYPFDVGKEAIDELKEESEEGFDLEDIKEKDLLEMADDAPIVKLVNHTIFQSIKEDASDIHIEPFEKELRVRYRIDGVMHHKNSPPKRYAGAIVSRIKIMSGMDIAEKRMPQGGRIQVKVGEKSIDLRVSVLPCNYGERVVMRILDKSKGVTDIDSLPLSPRDHKLIMAMINRPNGIILVSGPTGSGKTTTLYSILSRLNNEDCNIITVEDPIEYTINGINQVQVNVKSGLTFAIALREVLRQDPDTCLIGEIRDSETAQIATQAALTGHLVLSTIHTNSAPATITRLIDMGIEPFLIASALNCVIAQRLVRALCSDCKEMYRPAAEILKHMGIVEDPAKPINFYKAVGCDSCLKTGYKGRMPVFEVMEVSDEVAQLIVSKANATDIKKVAIAAGMTTLSDDGLRKVMAGLTTLEEVASVSFMEGFE